MRLDWLHLEAFGPFTDRRIDLSAGDCGVQVLFGANEAGKSSALRALRGLLYGIPERSSDDFLHDRRRLRVGALLRPSVGEPLLCYRRKGRKNTLLDDAGQPLDERRLTTMLGGVDEALFAKLFGIDHEALVSGGRALLEERGREAEALFGSGIGSHAVHRVLAELDAEAAELFAPRAKKPAINALLASLRDVERRLREQSLSATRWDETRVAAERAADALRRCDRALGEAKARLVALERLRRTLPALARRAALCAELAELRDTPALPADFPTRRAEVVDRRRVAQDARAQAAKRLQQLVHEIGTIELSQPLLEAHDAVDALFERRGELREAARDRPTLEAELVRSRARMDHLLDVLGPARADPQALSAIVSRRPRAEELARAQQAREQSARDAQQRLEGARARVQRLTVALDASAPGADLTALRAAVESARRAGDLDEVSDRLSMDVEALERRCNDELAALGRWNGSLDALLAAALPSIATIERFTQRYDALDERRERADRERAEARAAIEDSRESLRAIALAGEVPSEAALAASRAHRDRGWSLLRASDSRPGAMERVVPDYDPKQPLHQAFETAMSDADRLADRLRREAGRVHERAMHAARVEALEKRLRELDAELVRLAADTESCQHDWRQAWSESDGIAPAAPREMSAWRVAADRLRERAGRLAELRAQLERTASRSSGHCRELADALAALGRSAGGPEAARVPAGPVRLGSLLEHAEAALYAADEALRRREGLQQAVSAARDEVADLERASAASASARERWQQDWAALVGDLGLDPGLAVGEASTRFEQAREALELSHRLGELQRRLEGQAKEARAFERDVRAMLERLAPDLGTRAADEAIAELRERVARQRERKALLDNLERQASEERRSIATADAMLEACAQEVSELCAAAGGAAPEQLEQLESRWLRKVEAERGLREVDEELLRQGDGASIDALVRAADEADRDRVPVEHAALSARIADELEPQRRSLARSKYEADRDLQELGRDGQAADQAERREQLLESLRSRVARYLRVRLAGCLLREVIDRFRREHRDPILAAASGYFSTLTGGAFRAVQSDFDSDDHPVLTGVRPDGSRLAVEALSTGTRDQLYLALRLATLDHYLDRNEPLPFVVDDVLVHFDDVRARAALAALADFSGRTQVILFTHHASIAREARAMSARGGGVIVHRLEDATASAPAQRPRARLATGTPIDVDQGTRGQHR